MVWRSRPKPHTHASDAEGGTINTPAATITSLTVAALVAVGSVLSLAGGLAVTGALSAANVTASSMTVSGVVSAGTVLASTSAVSGFGSLRARAGAGDAGGPAPVVLYSWSGSSTTAGTVGEMVGASYRVPANTLVNPGDLIEVFCVAKATTTAKNKQLVVVVDGDKDGTGVSSNVARQWTNKSRVWRSSSSNLMHHAERERGDPGGSQGQSVDIDYANTVNTSAAFDVDCLIMSTTGTTAAGDEDMDLKLMRVDFYPAPL